MFKVVAIFIRILLKSILVKNQLNIDNFLILIMVEIPKKILKKFIFLKKVLHKSNKYGIINT